MNIPACNIGASESDHNNNDPCCCCCCCSMMAGCFTCKLLNWLHECSSRAVTQRQPYFHERTSFKGGDVSQSSAQACTLRHLNTCCVSANTAYPRLGPWRNLQVQNISEFFNWIGIWFAIKGPACKIWSHLHIVDWSKVNMLNRLNRRYTGITLKVFVHLFIFWWKLVSLSKPMKTKLTTELASSWGKRFLR